MYHVLQNRLRSNHVNGGHAGQIRYFVAMNKKLRNGTNSIQYKNLVPFFNYSTPRIFALTRNNKAYINNYINTVAQKYGVTRNAVISYITSIHANALEHFASRGMNTRVPLQATRYFFSKLQPVNIQTNKTINKNEVLNKLLTNYYTNYSGVQLILPRRDENENVKKYESAKQVRLKRKGVILGNIRAHLNTIGRVPVAAAGGNNGRAAGGAQRQSTSPTRRVGRANTAPSWRKKA